MKKFKFKGFTLAEISVALLIIGIILGVCGSVLNGDNGLKKKKYQYYLAYRTLEVAAGELLLKDNDYNYSANNGSFFPAAYAASNTPDCTSLGYYNAYYNSLTNQCECKSGFVPTVNNDKVCGEKLSDSDTRRLYAAIGPGTSAPHYIMCSTDFNAAGEYCCPENSYYDYSSASCRCIDGYVASGSGVSMTCVFDKSSSNTYCPKGYVYSANIESASGNGGCVVNTILDPGDFCKNIAKSMNVDSDKTYCKAISGYSNPFTQCTSDSSAKCYKAAYNAGLGTDGVYLSRAVKYGAFKDLKPNIVFSNGLKMWIPQQKLASIPGLSMSPKDMKNMEQNTCTVDTSKPTFEACASDDWCPSDGLCYNVSDNTRVYLVNASACCTSPEIKWDEMDENDWQQEAGGDKNIAFAKSGFTVLVDIDGDKGTGTLWDDVFPFYICTDGIVYPGYALGGGTPPNVPGTNSQLQIPLQNAGNNESILPTDVYYYNTSGTKRVRVTVQSSISFARAVCMAGIISPYAPYCLNLGFKTKGMTDLKNLESISDLSVDTKDDRARIIARRFRNVKESEYVEAGDKQTKVSNGYNPCADKTCYISVKRKMRLF